MHDEWEFATQRAIDRVAGEVVLLTAAPPLEHWRLDQPAQESARLLERIAPW
jgi:hypothetical protein